MKTTPRAQGNANRGNTAPYATDAELADLKKYYERLGILGRVTPYRPDYRAQYIRQGLIIPAGTLTPMPEAVKDAPTLKLRGDEDYRKGNETDYVRRGDWERYT